MEGLLTDAEPLLEEDCLLTEALERDDVPGRDCIDEERDGAEYEREGDAADREAPPPMEELRLTDDEEERAAPPPPPRDCAYTVSGASTRAAAIETERIIL